LAGCEEVSPLLVSGHHANVEKWRRQEALKRTLQRRPDLLEKAELTDQERKWLVELQRETEHKQGRT